MKTILRYARPYRLLIIWTLFLKLFAAIMDLLIPSFLARIVDQALPAGDRRQIYVWGGWMVLCAILSLITNVSANQLAARTSGEMTRTLRRDLFSKLTNASQRQLDAVTIPSAVSRLTSDTYNLNQLFNRTQRIGVRAPILLIGGIAITFTMDPLLTLVLVATLPLIALVAYWVTKKSVPMYTALQQKLDQAVRIVQENITGVRVIKALSKVPHEKQRFAHANAALAQSEQQAGAVMAITNPLTSLILNLGLILVVLTGAWLIGAERSSIGNIIAFLNYFAILLMATLGITRIFVIYSKGAASAQRVEEVLLQQDDMPQLAGDASTADSPYHIEFRDVSFAYHPGGNHLSHISFALRRGETLGIIGATGSGKSTLAALLLRLYDPAQGQILINGRDIRTYAKEELHAMFGVVFQNDFIMADTLEENIRYFRPLADAAVAAAARDAQAKEFIAAKEGGLQYAAAVRGNNLSGGQKQRILLARALAGTPDILVLDDAASALDYATDARLRRALNRQSQQMTKVIIAQRVSTLRRAQQIMMLDDGHMLCFGTHEQLLQNCPEYRAISQTQMGDGTGGGDAA